MKVIALACSARKRGNCYAIANIMLRHLETKGLETEILNAYDYKITPCSNCDYECFEFPKSCPIQDDVPEIWEKMKDADGVVLAIPTYYGMPSALCKSIIDREQGILNWITPEFRNLDSVWKEKTVALIVVANGGGENVKNIVLGYFPAQTKKLAEIFSYCIYNTVGYKGDLTKNKEVVSKAKQLAEDMYHLLKQEKVRNFM